MNKVKNPCDSSSQSRGSLQFPDKEMGLARADPAHHPCIVCDNQMLYIFYDSTRKIVKQENQNNNKRKLISLQCVTYFPDSYTSALWTTSKSPSPLHHNSLRKTRAWAFQPAHTQTRYLRYSGVFLFWLALWKRSARESDAED